MRKLKLQMQCTVDGFVAGPEGELNWMTLNWDESLKKYVNELTNSIEFILLGRKMADGFINYWTDIVKNKPEDPQIDFAKKMYDTPKVVFSNTLGETDLTGLKWANTSFATGDITGEINQLKKKGKKDIIVYGGATFVSSLISEGLIDEFYLFINPVVIGDGMTIFNGTSQQNDLKLINVIPFECGIVLLKYVPK